MRAVTDLLWSLAVVVTGIATLAVLVAGVIAIVAHARLWFLRRAAADGDAITLIALTGLVLLAAVVLYLLLEPVFAYSAAWP